MTADEFVKIVRKGSDKLRIDEVVINTGSNELHGKGLLEISSKKIKGIVTIEEGDKLPQMFASNIFTKKDKWNLTGLIEDTLQFKCSVWPPSRIQHSWPSDAPLGVTRITLNLHPIDLTPTGWDAASREQRKQFLEKEKVPTAAWGVENREDNVDFYATLLDYPLDTSTWGNEIKGETERFDFVLKKKEDASDLRVSLTSKAGQSSQGQEKDWKSFHAFMNALAFVTGVNAWPYRVEYWRASQKLIDRVTAAEPLAKTIHVPFTKAFIFNTRTGKISWSFPDTVKLITKFFDIDPLSQEIAYLLFLFRQAGSKGVHRDILIITLCVLFENLVRHIFVGLKLEEKARAESQLYQSFEQAKNKIIEQMDPKLLATDEGYQRVQNIVKSAEAFNFKRMFKAVVKHFGLRWEGDMDSIFNTWDQTRHPVIHQTEYSARTEGDLKDVSKAEFQIAGAINILLLKLFGYSGFVSNSVLEDQYKQI